MAAAVASAATGKNAVIKGSFPFVMQTYDRPTLTPLPLLSLSLSLSDASVQARAKKPLSAQRRGRKVERGRERRNEIGSLHIAVK